MKRERNGPPAGVENGEELAVVDEAARTRPKGAPPQAVAALRMEKLLLWVVGRAEAFPRQHKFTLGDKWLETCLEVQTLLVEATYSRDKRQALSGASRGLIRARVLARLAREVKAIAPRQEAYFASESAHIGKMVGGWLCSRARRRAPDDSVPAEVNP